jgi:hypothetical protein
MEQYAAQRTAALQVGKKKHLPLYHDAHRDSVLLDIGYLE